MTAPRPEEYAAEELEHFARRMRAEADNWSTDITGETFPCGIGQGMRIAAAMLERRARTLRKAK